MQKLQCTHNKKEKKHNTAKNTAYKDKKYAMHGKEQ